MQRYHAGGVMKKVILAILLVCIILIGIFVIYKFVLPKEPIDNGVLIINGRVLEGTNVTIYDGYDAKLPLLEVISNIGFQIEWADTTIANVTFEDRTFVIDLKEKSFIENGGKFGETFNYLTCPPGGSSYICELYENEIYLDRCTFYAAMRMIGFDMSIEVSYRDATVVIETRE